MDQDTRELLAKSLRHVLTEPSERPLGERFSELGWDDVLADDAPTALQILFEVKGETLAAVDALGPLVAGAIAEAADEHDLAAASIVLPSSLHPDRTTARAAGDAIAVDGVVLRALARGEQLIVPVAGAAGFRLAVVDVDGIGYREVGGIDPDMGLHAVEGTAAATSWVEGEVAASAWRAAITHGRWAVAAELVGIGASVLADAVEYTKARHQYGRPIGSFQALQHRVADAHASLVGARHVVDEAATSGSSWAALVAKALAGRAAEDACTQAQQCYGAIGFTWEHPLHRSLRRTYALDRLLGDWRTLEIEIGSRLQASVDVPKIGGL